MMTGIFARRTTGSTVEESDVHVLAAELVTRVHRFFRRIDEPEVDDFHARAVELRADFSQVAFQPFF